MFPTVTVGCRDRYAESNDMTLIPRLVIQILSAVFSLLVAGSAAVGSNGLAAVVAAVAVIGVVVATAFRSAATLAVLLSVCTIVGSNPSQELVALSGLCTYLVF